MKRIQAIFELLITENFIVVTDSRVLAKVRPYRLSDFAGHLTDLSEEMGRAEVEHDATCDCMKDVD